MVKESFYRSYLKTDHWREFSGAKIEHVGRRCEMCSRTTQLEVHHLHYRTLWRESFDDVRVFCRTCHQDHHDKEIASKALHVKKKDSKLVPRESARIQLMELGKEFDRIQTLYLTRIETMKGMEKEMKRIKGRMKDLRKQIASPV